MTAAASACSGSQARGSSSPTAVAKAKAEAEWPEGNDVEPGILTLRPAGTFSPARSGRARLSSPLPTRLAVAEASPMLATPSHGGPPRPARPEREHPGDGEPQLGVVGGRRQPTQDQVEARRRRGRDRPVDGLVDLVELPKGTPVDGRRRRRPPATGAVTHRRCPAPVRAICHRRFQSMTGVGSGTPGRSRGTRTRRAAGCTVQRTGVSSSSASPSTPTGIWAASASMTTSRAGQPGQPPRAAPAQQPGRLGGALDRDGQHPQGAAVQPGPAPEPGDVVGPIDVVAHQDRLGPLDGHVLGPGHQPRPAAGRPADRAASRSSCGACRRGRPGSARWRHRPRRRRC